MKNRATLAGGCFWCIEWAFHFEYGIESIQSGYTGGDLPNPTYQEVCEGRTGHYEAVELVFDPEKITFLQILQIFWCHIDPLDTKGQFFDRGSQYQTAIFYHNSIQKRQAEASKIAIQTQFSVPIATLILPGATFYPAEIEHQGYCIKRPDHFHQYNKAHQEVLQKIWEKRQTIGGELKERLTPLQYRVTQLEETEPPFENPYWDHHKKGIYVDIITGDPLFISSDKFDSGCGWPSFTRPINKEKLIEKKDVKLGVERTEVVSADSGAHLGHVFSDGPTSTGLRYCINSAALYFIPIDKMKERGYAEWYHFLNENS